VKSEEEEKRVFGGFGWRLEPVQFLQGFYVCSLNHANARSASCLRVGNP